MPSPTRLVATQGHDNAPQSSKRTMSDAEFAPQDSKKSRRTSSAEPSTRHDSTRDTKRRRRRRKKAPIVGVGPSKNEAVQSRLDGRSRAPLSTRNEVVRFTSDPPEADLPAGVVPASKDSSQAPSPALLDGGQASSSHTLDSIQGGAMLSPRVKQPALPANDIAEPSTRVAQLEAELKSKNALVASHQALLNQVQQAVTCQVCLDLMYKPYALAPCGHLACHSCLVNWFTAPPPDNRQTPPTIMRRKTCPHCRAVVRERPVEVWGVKSIAQAMGKSGLLPNLSSIPVGGPESLNTNADPWKDIFPKAGATSHRGFSWFLPGVDIDDDDIHGDIGHHGEDVGMLDVEDGGIYRCLDCMHEIWDGVCTSCGRVYPGHRPGDEEDDEGDPVGWLEDQVGAEEVDVAEDPSWMGLEDGEADDDGDMDEWRPYAPWRRQFHMLRGPWGFLGTIHVDEEEEEEDGDDMYARVDDLRVRDEDEESGDEGYESSFIDDEGDGAADLSGGPRIYELGSDEEDEPGHVARERGRRRARIVASSDEEGDKSEW